MKLYLAYGANTNFAKMKERCPAARYICSITVNHHQMVFRRVADVIPMRDRRVECALWLLTPECEAALDRFEGFPTTYVKKYMRVGLEGQWHRVMLYVMRNQRARGQQQPSEAYEATLRGGYADCGLPIAQIDNAINRAKEYERAHPAPKPIASSTGGWSDGSSVVRQMSRASAGGDYYQQRLPLGRRESMAERERRLAKEEEERLEKAADDFFRSLYDRTRNNTIN